MATGFGLCLLGGQGHLLYAAEDWLIRDAVVADLSASALPAYAWNGATWVLRAPLGMYLLPGALGRLAGLGAAHGVGVLFRLPSTASSPSKMKTQNPSAGPQIPIKSSPLSKEGTKC